MLRQQQLSMEEVRICLAVVKISVHSVMDKDFYVTNALRITGTDT